MLLGYKETWMKLKCVFLSEERYILYDSDYLTFKRRQNSRHSSNKKKKGIIRGQEIGLEAR